MYNTGNVELQPLNTEPDSVEIITEQRWWVFSYLQQESNPTVLQLLIFWHFAAGVTMTPLPCRILECRSAYG
jgi:hypothetical protein